MSGTILAIIGGLIILGLAGYATHLLRQLKKQKELQAQHQKLAIEKRNANIFDNVKIISQATLQGQCDLSEASIRLYNIMDHVQGEDRVDFDDVFPAISELYHTVKDMPRGEARNGMEKKARMKDNLIRHKTETRLHDEIMVELEVLLKKIAPLNNQINVQMI
ncbi:DUF2489 domain-containing protein [Vibrio sp.]|nr:DUF2489 domain-containing protein [Vibrio sp.]